MGGELRCPSCGRAHDSGERFCAECAMPLVLGSGDEPDTGPLRRRARKIKPQFARGPLVKVARAANQPEAELIEGLLLEEGIPCMLRRSGGADVPDFLAAGPRDVLVPESGADAAREALAPPPAWAREAPPPPGGG
jgi:Putative prokaryotic signal transducing protein